MHASVLSTKTKAPGAAFPVKRRSWIKALTGVVKIWKFSSLGWTEVPLKRSWWLEHCHFHHYSLYLKQQSIHDWNSSVFRGEAARRRPVQACVKRAACRKEIAGAGRLAKRNWPKFSIYLDRVRSCWSAKSHRSGKYPLRTAT
jgi:hypothetical protein